MYVWVWLPGASTPIVAGRIDRIDGDIKFTYGDSYLANPLAVALYLPELPLRAGTINPPKGLRAPGCIVDAGPDGWGRRVILRKIAGVGADIDVGALDLVTYLLESGSDRTGALDFQTSATEYVPRVNHGTLEELLEAAERVEQGVPFSPAVDLALLHGSSLGGARPKTHINDGPRRLIAKFARLSDTYSIVKAEGVAMNLARRVGIDVATVEVIECARRDVLLVERFDRTPVVGQRRMMVSALTVLGLDEWGGQLATYPGLADEIRQRFTEPKKSLRELFSRVAFNICVGNTDDHARNHSAFWDGSDLSLTPAYDICPQLRSGGEAVQAMAIGADRYQFSRLSGLVAAAPLYHLTPVEGQEIIDHQIEVIRSQWDAAADAARMTQVDRDLLWGRAILNPYCLEKE